MTTRNTCTRALRLARRLPVGWWALLALLLPVLAAGACGKRTAPLPIAGTLPVPAGLKAWQREARVMVAWRVAPREQAERHDGLEGFELLVERLPLNCPACPPDERRELALPLHERKPEHRNSGNGAHMLEGGWAYFDFTPPPQPVTWRFRVAARFGAGTGRHSATVFLETPARVPAHRLMWEQAGGGKPVEGFRAVRLYWRPRRERIVRTITSERVMVKQDRFYRVNLYRRASGGAWPLRPLNVHPVETGQLVLRVADAEAVAFHLRLVDQFGNEGPPSPPVSIAPAAEGQQ